MVNQIQVLPIILQLLLKVVKSLDVFLSSPQFDVLDQLLRLVLAHNSHEIVEGCHLLCN